MLTDAPASQAACAAGATSKGLAASTATASPGRTPCAASTRAPAHAAACTWAQLVRTGSCGSPVLIPDTVRHSYRRPVHARPRLTVLGSVNMDLVVRTARLPGPGETVLGTTFATSQGGKGANQAIAAARAGADV